MSDATEKQLKAASKGYATAHRALELRRDELYSAIRKASHAGMTMRAISESTGLSHQRIAQIVSGD
jgi:hypothetical protein